MVVLFGGIRLASAIRSKNLAKVLKLLQSGVKPDVREASYDDYPLEIAVHANSPDIVAALMDHGAKTTYARSGMRHRSVLTLALEREFYGVASMLIQKDPKMLNEVMFGKTTLHCIAEKGNAEAVSWLLEKGADPMIKSGDNRTALYYAREEKRDEVIAVLMPYYKEEPRLLPAAELDVWQMQGEAKIAHITTDKTLGFKITDIFNFAVNERMTICQSLTGIQQSSETKSFDHCGTAVLEEALNALQNQGGGKGIASFILKKRL